MMMMMMQNHWPFIVVGLFLSLLCCHAQAKASAEVYLRDQSTYIICLKSGVTEIEQQHFVGKLKRKSKTAKHFGVEIMEKFFMINCLTAKLSKKALQWVWICKQHMHVVLLLH